jgi:hypothetical protein
MLYLPSLLLPLYHLQRPYRHCSEWWGLSLLPPIDRSLRFGVPQHRRREVSCFLNSEHELIKKCGRHVQTWYGRYTNGTLHPCSPSWSVSRPPSRWVYQPEYNFPSNILYRHRLVRSHLDCIILLRSRNVPTQDPPTSSGQEEVGDGRWKMVLPPRQKCEDDRRGVS